MERVKKLHAWMLATLCWALSLSSVAAVEETRVALIIGNSDYKVAPLANPANDAADLAHALEKKGFKVLVRENVSERGLKEAVEIFANHLKKGGVGLFFFAGHGVQLKEQNFLLPTDLGFESESDISFKSISAEYVLSRMAEAGNRVNVVILDACRNNPFQQARSRSISRGLGVMSVGKAEKGTFIAYATSPGATAADGTGRNGLYTKYLLQSLESGDSDIDKVFGRVRTAVVQETEGNQVPWVSSSLIGQFYFEPGQDLAAARKPQPRMNPTPDTERNLAVVTYDPLQERALWEMIKDSRNVADFRAYLERFPSGPHSAYARWMTVKYGGGNPVELAIVEPQKNLMTAPAQSPLPLPVAPVPSVLTPQGGMPPPPGAASQQAAGQEFRDCAECPQMVMLPAGNFVMGSGSDDPFAEPDEQPPRTVTVDGAIAIGKYEVTRAQYSAFARETGRFHPPGCISTRGGRFHTNRQASWEHPGFAQSQNDPVVCVSWEDASAYASWLAKKTGQPYRLPNEAEWEYAARAGNPRPRYWADGSSAAACKYASVADHALRATERGIQSFPCSDGYAQTAPVGRFLPNGFGLHDMLGNVWEWVADCWNVGHAGASGRAEPRTTGNCDIRVFRGGAWNSKPGTVRAAYRDRDTKDERHENLGFRVAR